MSAAQKYEAHASTHTYTYHIHEHAWKAMEARGAKAFLPPQRAQTGARANESEYRMCLIQTDPILCFRFGALAGGRGTPERRLQAERQRNSAGCGASIEENTQGQGLTNPAG